MADVNKLVFSVLQFLKEQTMTGGLDDEAVESLEVAIQCLESSFKVDINDPETVTKYQVQRNLLDIFNAQLSNEPDSDFSSLSLHEATETEKDEAEQFKNKGNDFMKTEKFSDALECYSKAVKLDSKNAVYFCNRAAAYSKLNKHQQAIEDCNRALTIDSNYSKAYGRMGIAYTALNDHESARECYRKALELDPDNQSYQNNLEIAEQKLREAATSVGFGAGPGMDLAGMLNNPALMNMATQFMSNPQMQQMMTSVLSGSQGDMSMAGGLNPLLQAGQQLASQMQQQNPDLVAELRQQVQNQGRQDSQPPPDSEGQ
ncbi:small glutamine-rich tetratricopeptide repeat-containing protein alpha [Patella vulgata]|uniref:small glutamine-rich tetratricopeptide repeat-containing protein alpha n=1 Tax=Patella vulgata TaxID=6465 RepID=UPI0021803B9A|nr:small glutamine-rich tetratricopeptide repeat-containing protein alpha [Patella vulgata]XP_050403768.1 small glutamine-rich tetratricopeptide repeat-containing protein alpha [Patella vulgata]